MKHWDEYLITGLWILAGMLAGRIFWPLYFGAVAWCKEFKAQKEFSFHCTRQNLNTEYRHAGEKKRVTK